MPKGWAAELSLSPFRRVAPVAERRFRFGRRKKADNPEESEAPAEADIPEDSDAPSDDANAKGLPGEPPTPPSLTPAPSDPASAEEPETALQPSLEEADGEGDESEAEPPE